MFLPILTKHVKTLASLNIVNVLIALIIMSVLCVHYGEAGVPIPGHSDAPTPFEWLFATGFNGAYNTFGSGTTAGAIGNYGRFVSGGAGSSHGYH